MDDKLRQLVQQLITGTEIGQISWTDTSDENAFRASMPSGMLRVQRRLRLDEEEQEVTDYSLTLLDRKSREVDDYDPAMPAAVTELANLWQLARRSARGAADVLDTLLKETATRVGAGK